MTDGQIETASIKMGDKLSSTANPSLAVCGIVRPISVSGNYSAAHWSDVASIIDEAVLDAGFEPRLVSDASSTGIIHSRIVKNLYTNPIVVCDISGKNPNVMLELGMRLAFDKPVVVVKDEETEYSFDTSPIEHLTYPRSSNYGAILEFKKDLTEKIKATAFEDDSSRSFLKQFGPIKLPEISQESVPAFEVLRDEIADLKSLVRNAVLTNAKSEPTRIADSPIIFSIRDLTDDQFSELKTQAEKLSPIDKLVLSSLGGRRVARVKANSMDGWTKDDARSAFRDLLAEFRRNYPGSAQGEDE